MQDPIPPSIFYGHTQRLIDTWEKKHQQNFDSIVIINGKSSPGNQRTVAILSWFLAGYNLADTILFFTRNQFVIYTSGRKIKFLSNIAEDPQAKKYNLTFVEKEDDNMKAYEKIWTTLHSGVQKPKVGLLLNDVKIGAIAQDFDKFLKNSNHQGVQVIGFFNQCFQKKDPTEIENIKKSGRVTAYFEEKFIKQVQKVIDTGKRTKHRQLTQKITQIMGSQAEMKKLIVKLKQQELNKDYIDNGPIASIQSGGQYKHRLFAQADDSDLRSDCIILGLGSLYRSYNTYISRTLLIDPTDFQKNIYKKVETLSKIVTQNLKAGVKLSDVYKKAKMFVEEHLKGLEMPKSLGFGIGIFLKQNTLAITESSEKTVQAGNVFLVDLTFVDIQYEAKKGGKKKFGVQLIDTVVIQEKGQQVITGAVLKSLTDISYSLGDDEQEERKRPNNRNDLPEQSNIIEGSRRRRRNEVAQERLKSQKQRNEHQKKLKKQKLEELKERVNENFSGDMKKQVVIEASKIQSYKTRQQIPRDQMKKNMIYVDNKNNTILLPIKGTHIPFHILLLKSVVKSDEGKFASLRFNFHLPNSISNITFPKFTQPSVFVKEIVFRSQQTARFTEIEKQVKALQKKIRTQTSEKHAKEDIVEQEKLNLNRGKRPILRDLFPRPTVGQKKMKGNLQCHFNGFRYTTAKGQSIDIAFSNIKFAFFQPCENEIIAAIHFRLREPILVAKKKTEDIQFYSEGGNSAEDVVGRGRGMREDSDDEQRQKEARKKVDREFLAWTKACMEFIGGQFTFEIPDRQKGFYGTPYKGNSLIQPTKTCLINVTQIPFFILNLSDIEVACFERMYANLKSFDVTFVFKDYENNIRVNSIPIKDVERVKDFLDDHGIIFYDLGKSMNWSKFLAGIRYDFKKFVQDGAWTAWDDQQGDQQPLSEGDSEFSASDDELEEQSSQQSDDDEDESDYDEDDDDDSEDGDQDLDEEGMSWDELQEKAEKEDRQRLRRDIEKEKLMSRKKRWRLRS